MNKTSRKTFLLILAVGVCLACSMSSSIGAQDTSVPTTKALATKALATKATLGDMASYITPDAAIAGMVYPRYVLQAKELEFFPKEIISAGCLKDFGFDPMDIESAVLTIAPPSQTLMPGMGLAVRMVKPYTIDQLKGDITRDMEKSTYEGRPCLVSKMPGAPSIYMPDDRTYLIATPPALKAMLANHKKPEKGPARKLLDTVDPASNAAVVADIKSVRRILTAMINSPRMPPALGDIKPLPQLVDSLRIQVKVVGGMKLSIDLTAENDSNAKEVKTIASKMIELARTILMANMTRYQRDSSDAIDQAYIKYMTRLLTTIAKGLQPTQDGKVVKWELTPPRQQQIAILGGLTGQSIPAMRAAREAARRMTSSIQLKQIALGMLNYESAKGHYPQRASFDQNGKPLLSWRVHILPYLEQEDLYKKFKLDEPWDSPHNKKLIPLMPDVYRNPSNPAPLTDGKSDYVVPTGPGSIFEDKNKTRIRDISDGMSNAILVVEIDPDRAVTWTKPDDLKYDKSKPMANLGKAHPGGFNAAMADGSVRFFSKFMLDNETLLRFFQMNDGKPVPEDF